MRFASTTAQLAELEQSIHHRIGTHNADPKPFGWHEYADAVPASVARAAATFDQPCQTFINQALHEAMAVERLEATLRRVIQEEMRAGRRCWCEMVGMPTKGSMARVWGSLAGMLWAALRPPIRAARELLWLAAAETAALPIAHGLATGGWPWHSLASGQLAVFAVDVGALALAAVFSTLAHAAGRRARDGKGNSVWAG